MKNRELQIDKCRAALLRVFKRIQNLGSVGDEIKIREDVFRISKVYSFEGKCYKSVIWHPVNETAICFSKFIKVIEVDSISGPKLVSPRLAKVHDFRFVFKQREEILNSFIELYEIRTQYYGTLVKNLKKLSIKIRKAHGNVES